MEKAPDFLKNFFTFQPRCAIFIKLANYAASPISQFRETAWFVNGHSADLVLRVRAEIMKGGNNHDP